MNSGNAGNCMKDYIYIMKVIDNVYGVRYMNK